MRYSPKGPSPKPEGTKHVLVQRITSQRVKVQNFKGQSGQSPNSLSPKTDSPKQDLVQKGGSKKAMGLSPGRTKSDLAYFRTYKGVKLSEKDEKLIGWGRELNRANHYTTSSDVWYTEF